MPFGTLTIGTVTFVETSNGRYLDNSVAFGGPRNEVKITPGTLARKATPPTTNCSISRTLEKDITVGDDVLRKRVNVALSIQTTDGITTEEIDGLVSDIAECLTPEILTQILNGRN